jgi:hypothetical protein
MAQHDPRFDPSTREPQPRRTRESSDNPLDSGLRRKFLAFCEDNPGAEECRMYDV